MNASLLAPHAGEETVLMTDDAARDLCATELASLVAQGDSAVEAALLGSLTRPGIAPGDLSWRHALLEDAVGDPSCFRELYRIASEAAALAVRSTWLARETSPHARAMRTRDVAGALLPKLVAFSTSLQSLRGTSGAATRLLELGRTVLDPSLLARLGQTIDLLRPSERLEVSTRLGPSSLPAALELRVPLPEARSWWPRRREPGVAIPPRDQAASEAFRELVAHAMAPALDVAVAGVRAYVELAVSLRDDLAWVVGAISLNDALHVRGLPVCTAEQSKDSSLAFDRLADPVLALASNETLVTNTLEPTEAPVLVVTGANSGGKTTWLRSLGLALACQRAGLPVAAERFRCQPASRVVTLFPLEESADAGLFERELERTSRAIDTLAPHGWMLANEPFASTHAILAARIGEDLVAGLIDADVRVAVVTHLAELAQRLGSKGLALQACVDRAERPTFLVTPTPHVAAGRAISLLTARGGWPAPQR